MVKYICSRQHINNTYQLESVVKKEISERYDFGNRLLKIKDRINSKKFRDDLQGVYGFIDEKAFDKHKRMILDLSDL